MISFPLGTKMFQFPRFPSSGLWIQPEDDPERLRVENGFPHSEIPGSQPAHGSPRLIAGEGEKLTLFAIQLLRCTSFREADSAIQADGSQGVSHPPRRPTVPR